VWALCVILVVGFFVQGFVLSAIGMEEGSELAFASWAVLTAGMILYRRFAYRKGWTKVRDTFA
jgi:hypothetical protein